MRQGDRGKSEVTGRMAKGEESGKDTAVTRGSHACMQEEAEEIMRNKGMVRMEKDVA